MPSQTNTTPVQRKMVGWYDPGQLIDTARQVVVSLLLGTRADYRFLESLAGAQDIFDYSAGSELWFDYVADLGDGWNSTYTIASLLAAKTLKVWLPGSESKSFQTERGRILIMGGDEVYPTASRKGYEERTLGPYHCALEQTEEPHPNLFAIPGNHDWYDGLVSFSRLFCQERWFGGWKTRQKRSYFAIKLPHGWWLWGVDVQLESDIDEPQLQYFHQVTQQMQEGDRVILVTAEPHWIYGNIYDPQMQSNLAFLEEKIIGKTKATLKVLLAGDLHHYRRHESTDETHIQLVTSGGGGAFLHPTWGPPVERIRVGAGRGKECTLRAEFPDQKTSKRLLLRDLMFPVLNPKFGLLTGLFYFLLGAAAGPRLQEDLGLLPFEADNFFRALHFALREALGALPALAGMVVIILAFILFTDTHKKVYRVVGGSVHTLTHFLGILIVGWLALRVSMTHTGSVSPGSLGWKWVLGAGLFVGGYLVGAEILGLYLYISLRFFRRHANEAFSALHIPDYKSFLRLHIDPQGSLSIFPIGVRKVPRKWVAAEKPDSKTPKRVPAEGYEISPHLIEQPITVTSPPK